MQKTRERVADRDALDEPLRTDGTFLLTSKGRDNEYIVHSSSGQTKTTTIQYPQYCNLPVHKNQTMYSSLEYYLGNT